MANPDLLRWILFWAAAAVVVVAQLLLVISAARIRRSSTTAERPAPHNPRVELGWTLAAGVGLIALLAFTYRALTIL